MKDVYKDAMLLYTTTYILVASLCFRYAQAQCTVPTVATTNETAVKGTVLFTLTRTNVNGTQSFQIQQQTLSDPSYRAELKEFFLLTWTGVNGTFSLNRTLDLEELYVKFGQTVLTTITIEITCNGQSNPVPINVEPVNEFRPVFQQSPYNITLSELQQLNETIFDLKGRVADEDIPPPNNFLFGIESYLIQDLDAESYVRIGASTKGNIVLTKALNFNDKRELRLNVSVKDSTYTDAKTAYTTLNIHVSDADNQDPYFNLTGCPKPCIAAPYSAVTTLTFTGEMQIRPEVFKVVDPDTLGTRLIYEIESGDDYGMFTIDPSTGQVRQTRSVTDASYPESQVRLVIKIRKDLPQDLSNIAILSVLIAGRAPVNETDIPSVRESTEDTGTSLLIPVIVLAIFLAILIVAIIVIVVVIRKKQREATVNPETDKSEPQTEEEDIGTDRSADFPHVGDFNEKTVLNGKTTQGMTTDPLPPTPEGRAGKLPPLPLRDSATETTEGRRKKRSRRRNKNKEPEIFDGTREYNMGADPEFFDSSDKSKVKRSQRSYDKKLDPALRIKVPNDNNANDDSGFSG